MLGDTQENAAIEEQPVRRLGPAVDGFVIAASRVPDETLPRPRSSTGWSWSTGRRTGLASVIADFDFGTRQIVGHLASHGHRAFVFLGGPAESWSGARRWAGLCAAAEEYGLTATRFGPYTPTLASVLLPRTPCSRTAPPRWWPTTTCSPSVSCSGWPLVGVAVPDEVSVVGFDNVFGGGLLPSPADDAGGADRRGGCAGRSRCSRQQVTAGTRDTPARVLPTQLVVRASSGPRAGRSARQVWRP